MISISLCPVISTLNSLTFPPLPSVSDFCCLKYIKTLPLGAQVGASTKKPLAIKQFLTDARLPEIIKRICGPTIIYTEYLGTSFANEARIIDKIRNAVTEAGFTNDEYTGEHHSGLERFINEEVQVLIASRPISTGVDKLQHVCTNLIFNTWFKAKRPHFCLKAFSKHFMRL
mgnify:CR=1 FL=1